MIRRTGTVALVAALTLLLVASATPVAAATYTISFGSTGAPVAWTVPADVTSITVDLSGGAGGSAQLAPGGAGSRVVATIAVTPGETLTIHVGGAGQEASMDGTGGDGGWNGGGSSSAIAKSGGGGGASDIRQGGTGLADRVVVAGGGGGGGVYAPSSCLPDAHGGAGGAGGAVGGDGGTGEGDSGCALADPVLGGGGGSGGTAVAGGTGGLADPIPGNFGTPNDGTAGQLGVGGDGGSLVGFAFPVGEGGGGGGGYFGGGGGASGNEAADDGFNANKSGGGGGGGGSSYVIGSATDVTITDGGAAAGAGALTMTFDSEIAPATSVPAITPPPTDVRVTPTGGAPGSEVLGIALGLVVASGVLLASSVVATGRSILQTLTGPPRVGTRHSRPGARTDISDR